MEGMAVDILDTKINRSEDPIDSFTFNENATNPNASNEHFR